VACDVSSSNHGKNHPASAMPMRRRWSSPNAFHSRRVRVSCTSGNMTRHPKGLLVLGDALCSLDPINGQGMTMATLHANTLRTQIRHTNPVDPQAFCTAVAAVNKPV
jgi:2-polyprenyl-6-methoxyphenol hydroxylase-like FAD-dependent oxidoreductase